MDRERRNSDKPIPDNLHTILTDDQLHMLRQFQNFGWHLGFVRRPVFQEPVVVVFSPSGDSIGILEEDGSLTTDPHIQVRDLPEWVRVNAKS